MAQKKHRTPAPPPTAIKDRAERAMREGRFQLALELTKRLHKAMPTPVHQELVLQAYLGRASQLRTQGQTRDAVTVLHAALAVDHTTPVWLEQVAEELARCGEVNRALELLAQAPESAALAYVMAGAADAALQRETAGRALLPVSLDADFDRILLAFQQVEAGKDDDARATLQGIGLRSPFLEWKVLLRGFQAYYANDDARAQENWQRLAPERLPYRLAAPFRFRIDAEFRAAQSPETHTALQRQLDRMDGGEALLPQLRKLRGALTNPDSLAAALRQAETLLPALRRDAPQLESRLASCFYWAILDTGPDDILRYKRVFGRPAADPNFFRLEAMANEGGNFQDAHTSWQKYEKEIADDPKIWPSGQVERVRALVWLRMGRNAADILDDKEVAKLPASLRDHPDRLRPLNPSAEQCFRHALELAPDLLEAHEGLIQLHRRAARNAKAEQAARRLLEHIPDHLPTLEALSDLLLEREEYAEALELLKQAAKANPLNRHLRAKVGTAHLLAARSYSLADRFEEAGREYQAALNLNDPADAYTILARWAASEYRAGQTERAEELLGQARARTPSALAVAYLMLVESVRLKLHRSLKARFDKEFKAGLEEPPTAATAAAIVTFTLSLTKMKVVYYGQKAHAKKVLAYVEKAARADCTEAQMEQICTALIALNSVRAARRYLDAALKQFPANPLFPYLLAATYLKGDVSRAAVWQVRPMLEQARRLAEAMPADARRDKLLHDIQERLNALVAANPFAMGFMPDFFGQMFDDSYDDDDYDD